MKLTLNMLHSLTWKMLSHLALEHEHASMYETEVEGIRIIKCAHVKMEGDGGFGRSFTHYVIGNDPKVYKTHKSAVEAINELLDKQKR